MNHGLWFTLTGILYGISATLYCWMLGSGKLWVGKSARALLWGATGMHVGLTCMGWFKLLDLPPLKGITLMLSLSALTLSLAYLALMRRQRLEIIGAFVLPLVLVLFVGSRAGHLTGMSTQAQSVFLSLHIAVNLLGIVAFALASGLAATYLVQAQLLKQKRNSSLLFRLPPLETLDALGARMVMIGFPLLTAGVVSGAWWAVQMGALSTDGFRLSAVHLLALLAWCLFAMVLFFRLAVGWQGRRAALGTMLGFACAMAVLLGYYLRSPFGGTT